MNHKYAVAANIERYQRMLQSEQDPERRATIAQLLSEELRKEEALRDLHEDGSPD